MQMPDFWESMSTRAKRWTIIAAAIPATFAAGSTIGAAWANLDLPRPATWYEVREAARELRDELHEQNIRIARSDIDSRGRQISQDTLTLSKLKEREDEYKRKGEPVPEWLHQQVQGTIDAINYNAKERERSTKEMERKKK